MKLWLRFAVASTSLILFILATVGGLLFVAEKRHLLTSQQEEQATTVKRLAEVCRESVAEQNDLILLNYILSFKSNPGMEYAGFLDPAGKVVVHSDVSAVGETLEDGITKNLLRSAGIARQMTRNKSGAEILDVGLPVAYQDEKIGFARIGYRTLYFQEQVGKTLHDTMARFITVCGIVIVLGLIGSVIFARGLTRPIESLVEATRIVGKGELTHRIDVNRKDEIGLLAGSFNDMTVKLQELDQMKNDFVSSVSHELRSPLTALRGFLQMFQLGIQGPLTDAQKENVKVMMECTDRLGRFVNNILDVAKLEAGMIDFVLQPLDPKLIAGEMVFFFTPQANLEKLQVQFEAPETVSKVLGDPDRLKQVFTNLINNAMKYTPEGGRITVWIREEPGVVHMGVTDSGAGIPKDELTKLFSKFHQVKETKDKAKGKGTGLGLTIVKKIVEGCGGTVGVDSEFGKGTTFHFTLRKAPPEARPAAA